MKKYNQKSKCVKCGNSAVGVEHWPRMADFIGGSVYPVPERMVRMCLECGYRWNELPLDSTEPESDD